MPFFVFRLDELLCKRQRGNIPDEDVVTFSIFINGVERAHGSGRFFLGTGSKTSAQLHGTDGLLAFPAQNRLNMRSDWWAGPFQIELGDRVSVVYTGTNTSDEQLTSVRTQQQDELELKVLNYIAKKYVELIAGVEFGSDIGSAISEAFDKAFADPVGELVGYKRQGPCNGPVFADSVQLTGDQLRAVNFVPLPPPQLSKPPQPGYSQTSYTHSYTDAATHDTATCGDIAQTDVTFSVFKQSFISVRWAIAERFPPSYPTQFGPGLRQYGKHGARISVKALLGVLP